MHPSHPPRSHRDWLAPALVAVIAWLAVVDSLDPAGSYPAAPQGPGLTLDETFNVQQGVRLIEAARTYRLGVLHPDTLREVFGGPDDFEQPPPFGVYLPDHPPLGRLWIGLGHKLTRALVPPQNEHTPFVTACARTAPATAFALLIVLVGYTATRWYGVTGGLSASLSLVLMPRLFGHAHLAALETCIGLVYTAAVLCVAGFWIRASGLSRTLEASGTLASNGPSWKTAAWTGAVFGLALLTKIQAVLLPVPIALWAVYHWRKRAVVPLLIWTATGLLVFFAFWPWLWLDPVEHLREYFGRTTVRASLHTWYLGQRFADRAVPWHYPFVMFLVTVPMGLHLLGFWGVAARSRVQCPVSSVPQSSTLGPGHSAWSQPREQLVLACLLFPLIVFALPGVAVYDGARLFLVVFPLWSLMIGRGAGRAMSWLQSRCPRWGTGTLLGLFLAVQAYGLVVMWPCHLSYYNLLVGGLRGADRLGFEVTYWGDGITRSLLERTAEVVPAGAVVHVSPVLHQFQLQEMQDQSPILRHHGIRLRPFLRLDDPELRYVLLFRRRADLPASLNTPLPGARLLAEVRRQGVQLAALYAVNGAREL